MSAPDPKCGQVWVWPDGCEAMVTYVRPGGWVSFGASNLAKWQYVTQVGSGLLRGRRPRGWTWRTVKAADGRGGHMIPQRTAQRQAELNIAEHAWGCFECTGAIRVGDDVQRDQGLYRRGQHGAPSREGRHVRARAGACFWCSVRPELRATAEEGT